MIPTDFRTTISPSPIQNQLEFGESLCLLGSCFSENIGRKLIEGGVPVALNPFGILFNPSSVSIALKRIAQLKRYVKSELVSDKGNFHSLDHHGKFSGHSAEDVIETINEELERGHKLLKKSAVLIISLGTANVYSYKKDERVVANCHKIAPASFNKSTLSLDEIRMDLLEAIAEVRRLNKAVRIVLTVSPVRYLRDGLVNDRRSKSLLIIAAHDIIKELDNSYYFPSYELLTDDLRDYRFYADDMLHPSHMAIEYIWQAFKRWIFNKNALETLKEIEDLFKMANHRPINPQSEDALKFNTQLVAKIEEMEKKQVKANLQLHRQLLTQNSLL